MTTEKLTQLQEMEKELMKQLREVRQQIAALNQSEKPETKQNDTTTNKTTQQLENLSKQELIQILDNMSELKLTEAEKRKTKKWFIECIVRRQRAEQRGKAFLKVGRG